MPTTRDKSSPAFYAPHKSRHYIRKVKRHHDGPHTFSVCLLCMVYRGLTRVNLAQKEREGEPRERLMTVIKCDVSKNGYQKFGAEFTLVIPPPPPSLLDIFLPDVTGLKYHSLPPPLKSEFFPEFSIRASHLGGGGVRRQVQLSRFLMNRVNRHRFELYLTRDYLTSFHGCHGLSNRRCPRHVSQLNAFLSRPRWKRWIRQGTWHLNAATANEEYSRRGGNELRAYLLAARAAIMRAFIR